MAELGQAQLKLEVIVEVVLEVGVEGQVEVKHGVQLLVRIWLGGRVSKTIIKLNSTQVEVELKVGVDLGNNKVIRIRTFQLTPRLSKKDTLLCKQK